MLNRHFTEMRIHPALGYIFSILIFIGASIVLFNRIEIANYIYAAVSISLTQRLSEINRNTFLKICYSKTEFRKIRLTENIISTLPFLLFLIFKSNYISAFVVLSISCSLSFINIENKFNFTLPTPFKKNPYEFILGFRKTWIFLICTILLAIAAIQVNNFNLGAFALICSLLVCSSYYSPIENEFYVWMYSLKPSEFIFQKIKILLLHIIILNMPISLILTFYFPTKLLILSIIFAFGILASITSLLMKYSIFPQKTSISLGIIVAFSFINFPLLLITLPYLYRKTRTNLKTVLE